MLAGLPAGFRVRAVEDTELLRLDAADAASLLALLARRGGADRASRRRDAPARRPAHA
jgi:hypothetical protein